MNKGEGGKARFAQVFGEVLRTLRKDEHLTQERLAERAGIDRTYPSLLERGLREATLGMVIRLGWALKTDPGALVRMTLANLGSPEEAQNPQFATSEASIRQARTTPLARLARR